MGTNAVVERTTVQVPWGWWGCDLGDYRECSGTYQLYPYSSLPPIDETVLRGDFQWLLRPDEQAAPAAGDQHATAGLSSSLAARGLALPSSFVDFMNRGDLQDRVPSCTACEWDLLAEPIASPIEDGGVLVRFLRDQQDCLFWYLHLTPTCSAVACSPIPFDEEPLPDQPDVVAANTWWCAPSFEHFVYRFWLENVLWFSVHADGNLTDAGRAYLSHYSPVEPR